MHQSYVYHFHPVDGFRVIGKSSRKPLQNVGLHYKERMAKLQW